VRLRGDTCTFSWLAAGEPQLSDAVRSACADPANEAFLRAVSAREIAIKHRLDRRPLPEPPQTYVPNRRQWLQLDAIDLDERAASHTHRLPAHHRAPLDRALVARAVVRGMPLATPDPLIAAYSAPTLW